LGFVAIFGAGIAGLMHMSAAQAQMPPDLAEKVGAWAGWSTETQPALCTVQEGAYAGVKVSRDVKYGSPRNVVDIFVPRPAPPAPVLMFVMAAA
jgi:hypothetical protein